MAAGSTESGEGRGRPNCVNPNRFQEMEMAEETLTNCSRPIFDIKKWSLRNTRKLVNVVSLYHNSKKTIDIESTRNNQSMNLGKRPFSRLDLVELSHC